MLTVTELVPQARLVRVRVYDLSQPDLLLALDYLREQVREPAKWSDGPVLDKMLLFSNALDRDATLSSSPVLPELIHLTQMALEILSGTDWVERWSSLPDRATIRIYRDETNRYAVFETEV
jgi:hypothetical protein